LIKSREETFSLHYFLKIDFFFSIFVQQDADSNQSMGGCPSIFGSNAAVRHKKPEQHRRTMPTYENSPPQRRQNHVEPRIDEGMSCVNMYLSIVLFKNIFCIYEK